MLVQNSTRPLVFHQILSRFVIWYQRILNATTKHHSAKQESQQQVLNLFIKEFVLIDKILNAETKHHSAKQRQTTHCESLTVNFLSH